MTAAISDETRDAIGAVLGRLPSGLFIVTASNARGDETGLLASWVQQASFEPPMLTVAVNAKRYLHDWLRERPVLGLNLVGEQQTAFLKHFGGGFEPGEPAFTGQAMTHGNTGAPLLTNALGWLEGHVRGRLESGDHVVYAVEIVSARRGPAFTEMTPYVHVRKNGFRY